MGGKLRKQDPESFRGRPDGDGANIFSGGRTDKQMDLFLYKDEELRIKFRGKEMGQKPICELRGFFFQRVFKEKKPGPKTWVKKTGVPKLETNKIDSAMP